MSDVVTRLCEAIRTGSGVPDELFAGDAHFDATVPGWRFTLTGAARIAAQLSSWFPDPSLFEDLTRTPLPDGELLEFTASTQGPDGPYTVHQIHVLAIDGGRIRSHTAFCGGRWPADLLAEMGAAHAHV